MPYIEKDREGEYFNPVSETTQINPGNNCPIGDDGSTDYDINRSRWGWLIYGWDKMDFKKRMALFTPYVRIVRLLYKTSVEFDQVINDMIIDTQFEKCRMFNHLEYDEDNHGTPCFALIFDPINVNSIPDADIRSAVKSWGSRYGFLDSSDVDTITGTCPICSR